MRMASQATTAWEEDGQKVRNSVGLCFPVMTPLLSYDTQQPQRERAKRNKNKRSGGVELHSKATKIKKRMLIHIFGGQRRLDLVHQLGCEIYALKNQVYAYCKPP